MTKLGIALVVSSLIICASWIYSLDIYPQDRYEIHLCNKNKEDIEGLSGCHIVFDKMTAKTYQFYVGHFADGRRDMVIEKDSINKTYTMVEAK